MVLRTRIGCESRGLVRFEYTGDLSAGGAFVEAQEPFPVGREVIVEFSLPDIAVPIQAEGRVAWVAPAVSKRHGMGIEFMGLDEGIRRLLESYIIGNLENA